MDVVLGILLAVAVIAAVLLGMQVAAARATSSKALADLDSVRARLTAVESESRKSGDALESKRKEIEELKEKLRDTKKRRFDEQEAARAKRETQSAREEVEREMEKKLAAAREEADEARATARKLQAELEGLKSRRPAPAPAPEVKAEARPEPKPEAAPVETRVREVKPEEVARLEAAERELTTLRKKAAEFEAELRKARGRAETDRRVLIVQKGEVDLTKDKFRSLESRYNAIALERDNLRRSLFELEKEMKALRPTAEASIPTPAPARAQEPANGTHASEVPAAGTEGEAKA